MYNALLYTLNRCAIKVPKGGFHSDNIEGTVLVPQRTFSIFKTSADVIHFFNVVEDK